VGSVQVVLEFLDLKGSAVNYFAIKIYMSASACELPYVATQQSLLTPFTAKSIWSTGSSFPKPVPKQQICHHLSETLVVSPIDRADFEDL